MPWLVISIVLSLVLTVLLNVALRVFPDAGRRVARTMTGLMRSASDEAQTSDRPVRVWFPWKAMLLGSLIVTIVVNLLLWS